MAITFDYTPRFIREFKRLVKKYHSIQHDFENMKVSFMQNPMQGTSLGHNLRKVRLAITSKGSGKSGGARVITQVVVSLSAGLVRFVTVYDKSERNSISDKELTQLLKENDLI